MEQGFELNVDLIPEESDTFRTETLFFSCQPATFKEIKEKVEERCCVPECVQTILYQGNVVSESSTPQSFYLRSGDTVRVTYPHKGLVHEVKTVVKWLQKCTEVLLKFLEACNSGKKVTISDESAALLADCNAPLLLEEKLFSEWSDSSTSVNAQHFDYLGGIQLLVNFHKLLVTFRKEDINLSDRVYIPYLEFVCCRAIANYARDIDSSRRLAQCGGLDSCIGSFMIKPADDESLLINNNYAVLIEALRGIFNIAEIPDVQHKLSLRHDVIEQAFLAARSPMYSPHATTKRTISVLLCLSRSSEAHENIMKPELIEKLMRLLETHQEIQENSDDLNSEMMALKSYVGVVLAQMVCGSSYLLQGFPVSLLEKMAIIMKQACEGNALKIQQYEELYGFSWGTFLPCVGYLYEPYVELPDNNFSCQSSVSLIETLRIYSVDVLLQYLINSLGRRFHVEIIVQEKLVDFVTCLPWILPSGSKERASELLKKLAKFQQIQPPSLVSITKAYLAKAKWGLMRLMNMNSISELSIVS